jgi:hypothetical protein
MTAITEEIKAVKSHRDTSFQDRVSQAAEAKQKALDRLLSKPPMDPAIVAARQAASLEREAAQAEKRAIKKAAEQATKDKKAAEAGEAAAKLASVKPEMTDHERKLARDARYAARKRRK